MEFGDSPASIDARPFPFHVLTLFPAMIRQAVGHSILGRAIERRLIEVVATDIRDFTHDRHRTADDVPYGGGAGMVMKVEPLAESLRSIRPSAPDAPVVLLSPSGRQFDQATARRYATGPGVILVCGHYEGVDDRFRERFVDEELSIGDYVVSGGELPALVVLDAVARLVPGVLGNRSSLADESHDDGLLEYPQYTRPAEFEGLAVPDVLMSGNHAAVARYRKEKRLEKTRQNRPDLWQRLPPEVREPPVRASSRSRRPVQLGRPFDARQPPDRES